MTLGGDGPIEALRVELGDRVRSLLAGRRVPAAQPYPAGDPGLFGPGSITWRVHGDLAMLIGGLRAVLAQTMHPLAMAGVAQHSNYRTDPWGRLHRTGHYIGVTTFGSTRQALDAVVAVRRIHERVRGVAPDGRPYSATDPHLLSWVHATEVHSFLVAYERYGQRPLGAADADRYVAEMAVLGAEIGVDEVPTSRAELREYFAAIRPELAAGDDAREAVRFLLWPPVAPVVRPAYTVICAAGLGLLPAWVRRDLKVPSLPLADPLAVRPAARLLLGALGWSLGPSPSVETARTRAHA